MVARKERKGNSALSDSNVVFPAYCVSKHLQLHTTHTFVATTALRLTKYISLKAQSFFPYPDKAPIYINGRLIFKTPLQELSGHSTILDQFFLPPFFFSLNSFGVKISRKSEKSAISICLWWCNIVHSKKISSYQESDLCLLVKMLK